METFNLKLISKDRSKIFKMNGNGWWYVQGTRLDNEGGI